MTRLLRPCILAGLACASPCRAAAPSDVDRAGAIASPPDRVSDEELARQRGGFRIGMLDVNLGAEIRSYLGGTLVMRTNLNWTEAGTSVQRTSLAGSMPDATSEGSVLRLNGGQTLFVQRADTAIQNVIVNSASGVDVRQEIDARIDIAGYSPFRDGILAMRMGSALARTIIAASVPGRSD